MLRNNILAAAARAETDVQQGQPTTGHSCAAFIAPPPSPAPPSPAQTGHRLEQAGESSEAAASVSNSNLDYIASRREIQTNETMLQMLIIILMRTISQSALAMALEWSS